MKFETVQIHKHDTVYYVRCPDQSCNEGYLVETGRRITERTSDQNSKDKHSHLLKDACNGNHKHVDLDNIKITDSVYHNSRFNKTSEALYNKQYKPTLNTQEQ